MDKINPKETALIVIDMQFDFYAPDGKAAKRGRPVTKMQNIVKKLEKFTKEFINMGGLVIFTRFISGENITPKNLKKAVEKEGGDFPCVKGSGGEEIYNIKVPKKAIIIDKPHYDAFAYTDLEKILKQNNIKNILISGIRTEVCVDATAKRSASEGYDTYIISDLAATYDDKYKIHDYFLDFFKNYYGSVLTSDEILKLFNYWKLGNKF
jgi:ureidoacrylate peracid hydrolase